MKNKEILGSSYEIYVIGKTESYKEHFGNIEDVTLVVDIPELKADVSCKAIFIDGEALPVKEMKNVRALYPSIPIFYRSVNVQSQYLMQHVITTCLAHDITHISEEKTIEQIVEQLESVLFDRGNQ